MDPIADMLTSLVNAQRAGKKRVAVPYSKFKKELLDLLVQKGSVAHVRTQESPKAKLVVTLEYDEFGQPAMRGVKRISKPGRRVYARSKKMPFTYSQIGFIVVSTPEGLMDELQARREKIGGELICAIW